MACVTRGPVRIEPLVVPNVETATSTASACCPQSPRMRPIVSEPTGAMAATSRGESTA